MFESLGPLRGKCQVTTDSFMHEINLKFEHQVRRPPEGIVMVAGVRKMHKLAPHVWQLEVAPGYALQPVKKEVVKHLKQFYRGQ